MNANLFGYGTLKRGYGNNHFIAGAEFLGSDRAPGLLYQRDIPYALPPMTAEQWITGELYRVSEPMLARCDALEGHPDVYRRTAVVTQSGVRCWIYYYTRSIEEATFLPEGVWL